MFCFLHYRKLIQINIQALQIQSQQNSFLKSHSPKLIFLRYLKNSCRLSPEKALTVTKMLKHTPIRSTGRSLSFNLLTSDSSGDAATFIHGMISDLAHYDAASQDPPILSIHKCRRQRNKRSKKTSNSLPSPVDRNGPHVDGFESHCNGWSICDPLISGTGTAVKTVGSILQAMVFKSEKLCDITEAFGMYEERSGCITLNSTIDAIFRLHAVFARVKCCSCLF